MSDMEFPSREEISYWSGDKRGSWFTKEAVLAWGIPYPAPAGWARALKTKDAAFFIQHRIQIKRRPIPKQMSDDLFTWG